MTPHFLIVGAMKAGTTTLYYDLSHHPELSLPQLKEPDILIRFSDPEAARAAYAAHFSRAKRTGIRGEASTAYTKRPTHDGVPLAARAVCGPDLKIIYMRRDPVARIISQYKHETQHGTIEGDFAQAVRSYPRLIDYSRHDWQIAPWIETFGASHVLQIDLEAYSADRLPHLRRVLEHIGADPDKLPPIDTEAVANHEGENKAIRNPLLRTLVYSGFYQHVIRERLPRRLREGARRAILPPPKREKVVADAATIAFIEQRLGDEPSSECRA